MPSFSERRGLVAAKGLQTADMDTPLRNGLWTAFFELLFIKVGTQRNFMRSSQNWNRVGEVEDILPVVWLEFFKEASDTTPYRKAIVDRIRGVFMTGTWHEVYCLIEFILGLTPTWALASLVTSSNYALKRENAGYRIIGTTVSDITAPEEIAEVESALATKIDVVRIHLTTALEHLSNRASPDPRNSVKESISAVESICRLVAGEGRTLDDALKILGEKVLIHPALNKAFRTLYGYTSDEVRHGLLREGNVGSTEARFMLIACSAFINYVLAHAAEAGIELH
jgi:hypothetical protein